jgi:hypothetical protein
MEPPKFLSLEKHCNVEALLRMINRSFLLRSRDVETRTVRVSPHPIHTLYSAFQSKCYANSLMRELPVIAGWRAHLMSCGCCAYLEAHAWNERQGVDETESWVDTTPPLEECGTVSVLVRDPEHEVSAGLADYLSRSIFWANGERLQPTEKLLSESRRHGYVVFSDGETGFRSPGRARLLLSCLFGPGPYHLSPDIFIVCEDPSPHVAVKQEEPEGRIEFWFPDGRAREMTRNGFLRLAKILGISAVCAVGIAIICYVY